MPAIKLRKWTSTEDRLLIESIQRCQEEGEAPDYRMISKHIPHRSPKQCRERYENSLQPDVKRGEWCLEETMALARLMTRFGQNWALVKENLPNRTYNAIKKKGRKLLGEIVDRNCIPPGRKSKATANWAASEFSSLLKYHQEEPSRDYLTLALKLRTGRSEAEVERQLLSNCSCDQCTDKKYEVLYFDNDTVTQDNLGFKEKWSLWKASQVLGSLERDDEKPRFKNARRASTTSTSTSSTMLSSSTDGSKRRRIEIKEENVFDLDMETPRDEWFTLGNTDMNLEIKQENMWPTFEWDAANLDVNIDESFFLFPIM